MPSIRAVHVLALMFVQIAFQAATICIKPDTNKQPLEQPKHEALVIAKE
jgi:hypothetical protein